MPEPDAMRFRAFAQPQRQLGQAYLPGRRGGFHWRGERGPPAFLGSRQLGSAPKSNRMSHVLVFKWCLVFRGQFFEPPSHSEPLRRSLTATLQTSHAAVFLGAMCLRHLLLLSHFACVFAIPGSVHIPSQAEGGWAQTQIQQTLNQHSPKAQKHLQPWQGRLGPMWRARAGWLFPPKWYARGGCFPHSWYTHTHTHTRAHARTHARTHARKHARTHARKHKQREREKLRAQRALKQSVKQYTHTHTKYTNTNKTPFFFLIFESF